MVKGSSPSPSSIISLILESRRVRRRSSKCIPIPKRLTFPNTRDLELVAHPRTVNATLGWDIAYKGRMLGWTHRIGGYADQEAAKEEWVRRYQDMGGRLTNPWADTKGMW